MKTKITELLGIEYPIVQGAMAWIAEHHLAAAVSKAGGLGIIAGGAAPVDYIREEIRKARAITDKPLGMNIMLLSPNADDLAQLAIDEKIEVLTTGAGNPGKYMASWKDAGIKVMPVVASVALAKRMERAGADAVIAEGMEGGGHIGELTTMPLVPQVVDALDIPVIAAGGIADGRGMAAAFMLGAEGVQCGTVFLATDECYISDKYKELVLKATDISTVVTGRPSGHPVRSLKTPMARKCLELEKIGTEQSLEELDLDGLVVVRNGDAERLCVGSVIHLGEGRRRLDLHIARVRAVDQDLIRHLARDLAQLIVVDGQGRYAAARADALLARNNRHARRDHNVRDRLGAGSGGVIGRDIDYIAARSRVLRNGCNVVRVGESVLGAGVAHLLKHRGDGVDLVTGVRLSRAEQQADVLRIREQLVEHLRLAVQRRKVGRTGNVGAGRRGAGPALYAKRSAVIGDRSAEHRNIRRAGLCGLQGRRAVGHNQVNAAGDEVVGKYGAVVRVARSIADVNLDRAAGSRHQLGQLILEPMT